MFYFWWIHHDEFIKMMNPARVFFFWWIGNLSGKKKIKTLVVKRNSSSRPVCVRNKNLFWWKVHQKKWNLSGPDDEFFSFIKNSSWWIHQKPPNSSKIKHTNNFFLIILKNNQSIYQKINQFNLILSFILIKIITLLKLWN